LTSEWIASEAAVRRSSCGCNPGTPIAAAVPGTRTHAAVRERRLATGSRYCVVYGGLSAGEYTIWKDENTPAGSVTVIGARVTELDWSGPRNPL
jgi:hypothetical protein